jgi:hypothetical protein
LKIAAIAAAALIASSPLALAAGYGQSSATQGQQTLQTTTGTSGQMKKSVKSKKPARHVTRKRHHRIARSTPKHATTGMATSRTKRMMRETTGSASSQPAKKKLNTK